MTKKLLFVSHSHKLEGGAELSLLAIIKEAEKRHYKCHVILPGDGTFATSLEELGISYSIASYTWSAQSSYDPIHTEAGIALFNADSILEAYNIINKETPDVVITNTIMPPWTAYVASILGIPNVMMVRESFDERNSTRLLPSATTYLNKLSQTIDFFLYNSHYTKSVYSPFLSSRPSDVLYPIVNINKNKSLKHTKLISKKIRIIVSGSIVEHKNQLEAIKAIHTLVINGSSNIKLTIMGHADKKGYIHTLQQYIDNNKLHNYVAFKPFSSSPLEEVVKHDIVITPSLSEAFGRVTLEGQLAGRVVIGCNSGGTPELIDHMKTGLLYDGNDVHDLAKQIQWVIDNKKKAQEIALTGQEFAHRTFLSDSITDPFFSALKQPTISNKRKPGNLYYDPLYSLIQRNLHVNQILASYANSLHDSIEKNKSLEQRVNTLERQFSYKINSYVRTVIRRIKPKS